MLRDKKILIKNLLAKLVISTASLLYQNNAESVREMLETIFNTQISNQYNKSEKLLNLNAFKIRTL